MLTILTVLTLGVISVLLQPQLTHIPVRARR